MRNPAEPLAYYNGQFIPASQASVPVYDAGFVLGVTVTEQLRTFGGRLFRLPEHLERLRRSLEVIGVAIEQTDAELTQAAERLVEHHHGLLPEGEVRGGDDLGLALFVTPGPYATLAPRNANGPIVCLHTYPLPYAFWAEKYERGEALATTDVQQAPPECWPPRLKCRSRMHYYLADREAATRHPGARALLLDAARRVTETSTANIVVCRDGTLSTPPLARVLPGVSLAVVQEFARRLGIEFGFADLTPADVAAADEVLLTSTPWCLLPVCTFNGCPVGSGQPGDMYRGLLARWNELAGLDIAAQARTCARRGIAED